MLTGYRDRVTAMLCARLEPGGRAVSAAAATTGGEEGREEATLIHPVETYLHTYGILHEHWHIEDWIQTRQTLVRASLLWPGPK
jgi:hypothetical protein